jgi:arylsulfatase A-like enzyme
MILNPGSWPKRVTFVLRYLLVPLAASVALSAAVDSGRPNVIVILTDDQGHGDLGFHGNPILRTPRLDRLALESTRFTRFYVSPVCSPTRSSLLTGRYHYRTGVVDTYLGRSLMHPDETTLAELLAREGYRTGIFGKWHLGDNYPMRPIDQGFQEALVHKGGGIGQPSDPPGGESYFDPVLQHNGKPVKTRGYCSDVYTDAALAFIAAHHAQPFFVWLAFNAPHTPLEVPESYERRYREMNLEPARFPNPGRPIPAAYSAETTAKIYGMVENIDDNVGRLLDQLARLKLDARTVVVFLSDNGPQQPRFNNGLRGLKGSVYEGGLRVPFLVRWPGRFAAGREVDRIAAHIDLTPTILDLCRVPTPPDLRLDGRSLRPLLEGADGAWPERTLFFQWHRGNVPQAGRAFAAVTQDYKLAQADGVGEGTWTPPSPAALFHLAEDPCELNDIAASQPRIAERLRRAYDGWFADVTAARDYQVPSRITLGSPEENPSVLTRQDWRGPDAGWTPQSSGFWEVHVARAGSYSVGVHFPALERSGRIHLRIAQLEVEQGTASGATTMTFEDLPWPSGPARLETWLETDGTVFGPSYVVVTRNP